MGIYRARSCRRVAVFRAETNQDMSAMDDTLREASRTLGNAQQEAAWTIARKIQDELKPTATDHDLERLAYAIENFLRF